MDGYKIGQTWFEVIGTTIRKYTLLGYVPNREIVILDIDGRGKRMSKEDFKDKELTLITKRKDAVIERDRQRLEIIEEEIALKEQELMDLKAERDGING